MANLMNSVLAKLPEKIKAAAKIGRSVTEGTTSLTWEDSTKRKDYRGVSAWIMFFFYEDGTIHKIGYNQPAKSILYPEHIKNYANDVISGNTILLKSESRI